MVSKINQVLLCLMRYLPNAITHTTARAQQMKYMPLVIQKGLTPSMKSLSVPPPMAVAIPTIQAPNMSKCLAEARRMPDRAKANVPTNSITTNETGSRSVAPISCSKLISQSDMSVVECATL